MKMTAFMAVLTLPLLVIVVLVSPVYLGLLKLLNRFGILNRYHGQPVDLLGDEITFGWFCASEAEARVAVASAVSMLVDLIPSSVPGTEVESIRFVNPEAGMVLDRSCLRRITTNFGPEAATLLPGNQVEGGVILVNGELRLENFNLDARSPLNGDFSVELPLKLDRENLSGIASRHGFKLGYGGT